MDVFEAIMARRTIRKFKPEPVPEWKIEKILDAGRYAPSAENTQTWRYIIVKDPETKKLMADLSQERVRLSNAEVSFEARQERLWYLPPDVRPDALARVSDGSLFRFPEQADTVLVCCTSHTFQESPLCSLPYENNLAGLVMSIQNMWLATTALGLGGAYVANICEHVDARLNEILCEHLGIPRTWKPVALFPIGVPKHPVLGPPRFPLESICFVEQWGIPYKRLAFRKR
jgi:nicotinate-nucleotide--dimethylbenzimidazole phosphoribosyltransferase